MWGSSRLHADSYHRATNISKCHPEDEGAKRVRRIYALRLFPPRSVSTHRFAIEKRHGARSANGAEWSHLLFRPLRSDWHNETAKHRVCPGLH